MKGIPNDYNFEVLNKTTYEREDYKSLNDIVKAYKTNYYTVYELYKINNSSEDIKKHMGRKLRALYDKIEIKPLI
jgi:hypothetical protein